MTRTALYSHLLTPSFIRLPLGQTNRKLQLYAQIGRTVAARYHDDHPGCAAKLPAECQRNFKASARPATL